MKSLSDELRQAVTDEIDFKKLVEIIDRVELMEKALQRIPATFEAEKRENSKYRAETRIDAMISIALYRDINSVEDSRIAIEKCTNIEWDAD